MFLTENDYITLITDEDREFVEQSSADNRAAAEGMAVDQMKSYLRGQYDVAAVFDIDDVPDPDTRSKVLVMYCMDIALYHLHAMIPGRFIPDLRRTRYDDALNWLKDVAKGLIDPGLPLITNDDGQNVYSIRFGSQTKQDNSW